jgi:glycerol-3-phosphate acyltransferase PlsY
MAGVDLRRVGSGNLGATNLYRVLGWKYAVPAGMIDVAKGYVAAVFLSSIAGASLSGGHLWIPLVVGSAAIVGHVFPVYLRFRGGKGVATAAGVVLGVAPVPLLVSVGVWSLLLLSTGFMSLASMSAALAFPVAALIVAPADVHLFAASLIIASFIIVNHRSNIRRLFQGTEPRFGRKKEA